MDADDVKPDMQVRYIGRNKFGLPNEDTGTIFTVVARSYDRGSEEWLFNIRNEWGEERWNVSAKRLEPVTREWT